MGYLVKFRPDLADGTVRDVAVEADDYTPPTDDWGFVEFTTGEGRSTKLVVAIRNELILSITATE